MSAAPPPELATLLEALARAPYAHDFFNTLRRLENAHPGQPRLGRALRPQQEPVRLGQDPELDFAPASLSSFSEGGHAPPRLGVRFFGLFGPQGALPLHLTEFARERARHHADPSLARFADVFHHRMLLLFYRAWAEAQPVVHADRPQDDRFAKWLAALFGMASSALAERDVVGDAPKRFHAGTLSRGPKNAEGLRRLLQQQFAVPVQIESFVGHWMRLRPQDRTRLGGAPRLLRGAADADAVAPSGQAAQLGRGAVAGSKVWDRQSKFRVHLGPLTLPQYQAFLPGPSALPALRDWVRQHAGLGREWDLRLTLAADHVPRPRLGRGGRPDPSARLGLTTWLPGGPRRDRADLLLSPEHLRRPTTTETHHV